MTRLHKYMANRFTKILLHLEIPVKGRESLIPTQWLPHIHAYMAKSLNERGHHAIKVGGTENHVHILFDYSPKEALPDLVRDLKVATTNYFNNKKLAPFRFGWQTGYGCFSVSPRDREMISNYIQHQNEHHKGIGLKEEIIRILDKSGIKYDQSYIFNEY